MFKVLLINGYYRFIHKVVKPIVPRSTPLIGEYVNKISFRVYMHDNKDRLDNLLGRMTASLADELQELSQSLEDSGDEKANTLAQELKVTVNETRVISQSFKGEANV